MKTRALRFVHFFIIAVIIAAGLGTAQSWASEQQKMVRAITIEGNAIISPKAISAKLPFGVGEKVDKRGVAKAIQSVFSLGYFNDVEIYEEDIATDPKGINIYVVVTEKTPVSAITFEGNNNFTSEKIREAIDASKIKVLDEQELDALARRIAKAYVDKKTRHHVTVKGALKPAADGTTIAHFVIDEGTTSWIRKVTMAGNKSISSKELQKKIFIRPSWLLGFWDRAGVYHPDALTQDKYTIENIYQSNGYMGAHVIDTNVVEHDNGAMDITFVIDEGDLYRFNKISAVGNEIHSEKEILRYVPIVKGQLYSKDLIRSTMEDLRTMWGEDGYIYADVQPVIIPNEKDKTIDVKFVTSLENCYKTGDITISGNNKTLDKIIRRELLICRGDILKTRLLESSKNRLQLLDYFTPNDGVAWRLTKVDDEYVDVEVIVKEKSTGRIEGQIGYGAQADFNSPTGGFSVRGSIRDINFKGTGTRYNFDASYSHQDKLFNFMLGNDWLFDRPIMGSMDAFVRKLNYEDFRLTEHEQEERVIGGTLHSGFRIERLDFVNVMLGLGMEDIRYLTPTTINDKLKKDPHHEQIQRYIDHKFMSGDLFWLGGVVSQDVRNSSMFPSSGHQWALDLKLGVPNSGSPFGFIKAGLDVNWYTPIIDQYDVILRLHGHAGFIHCIKDRVTPYRELFHIGGPASVRGFVYGEIGPTLMGGSVGGTKMFFVNAELLFPITANHNLSGCFFYDGGACWDTPNSDTFTGHLLAKNNFEYRHAVGFGIKMLNPQPIQIEWGFKLDRKKKRGESIMEVHFGMARPF